MFSQNLRRITSFSSSLLGRSSCITSSSSLARRHLHSSLVVRATAGAGFEEPSTPKIDAIVNDIASLNLQEAAILVRELKTKLNIQEIAMPVMSAGAAAPAASAPEAEKEPEAKPMEKTSFTVKLEKVDAAAKTKLIKEIKSLIPGANLVEAKKFVESVPKIIKENVPKEEAEKLKKHLESLGSVVLLE